MSSSALPSSYSSTTTINTNLPTVPTVPLFRPYEDIPISTKTVIAVTNLEFDIEKIFYYLPLTDYILVPKRRGRSKIKLSTEANVVRAQQESLNQHVPVGSVISAQYKTYSRGVQLKKKNGANRKYFLNSMSVYVYLGSNKIINSKITRNGKFQVTGCKNTQHYVHCVKYLCSWIQYAQDCCGETLYKYKMNAPLSEHETEDDTYSPLYSICPPNIGVIYCGVMSNLDFKLPFMVAREKLDAFLNKHTEFYSLFESSLSTAANCKLRITEPFDKELLMTTLVPHPNKSYCFQVQEKMVSSDYYLNHLNPRERIKELKKARFCTFLIFASGSVIFSSAGPNARDAYNKFMNILIANRNKFEEKLDH
jgi:hypothetical protein